MLETQDYVKSFADPEAFGTVLHIALIKLYGTEAFDWEPYTWWSSIEDDTGFKVPSQNRDKLSALVTAVTTDHFYSQFEAFEKICWALNGEDPQFHTFCPLHVEEMAWGVSEVLLNDSPLEPENAEPVFSGDVKAYVRSILKAEGFYKAPEVLAFCDPDLVLDDYMPTDPQLKEEIETEQRLKLLRVKSYLRLQRNKLAKQLETYFPSFRLKRLSLASEPETQEASPVESVQAS